MKYLFTILIFCSCQKDPYCPPIGIVPNEVKTYYDYFINEAEKRNILLKENKVEIVLSGKFYVNGIPYIGYADNANNRITIDTSEGSYKIYKEHVILHELGHYFLHRDHRNDNLPNNNPTSIMNCCNYTNFNYYPYKREYYLNELFCPHTESPDWGN